VAESSEPPNRSLISTIAAKNDFAGRFIGGHEYHRGTKVSEKTEANRPSVKSLTAETAAVFAIASI